MGSGRTEHTHSTAYQYQLYLLRAKLTLEFSLSKADSNLQFIEVGWP